MKARMLSVLGWFRHRFGRHDEAPTRARRAPGRRPSTFESLERREVLSSSTFLPFATLPGQVTTAGKPAQVALHFSAGQVTSSQSSTVLVGFYVEAAPGSTSTPQVSEVDGPSGSLTRVVLPKRDHSSPSPSLFLTYLNASPTAAQDITVNVVEPGKQVGNFVLKAFLPGDVNGDGTVDQTDLSLVQAAYGTAVGQPNYAPTADFNADGHVGCVDRRLTQLNIGAHVAYTPPASTTASAATIAPVAITVPITTAVPVTTTAPVTTPVVQPVPVLTYVYPQTTGTGSVIAPTTSNGTAQATTPVYYYGQPVVQAPGYAAQPSSTPVYYYGQPVVQAPGYAQATGYIQPPASGPVYYYGQPYGQASSTPTPSTSMPVSYYVQQPAQAVNAAQPRSN